MRIYVPLTVIFDNPYQVRQNYGDIADFAENEIRPFLDQRPDTLGLQVPPQARIIDADGQPLANWHTVLIKAGAAGHALPELDTKRAQLEAAWQTLSASAQLIFGHRRLRALRHLAEQEPRFSVVPLDIVQLDDKQMLAEVFGENSFRKNTAAVEDIELMRHAFALLGDDATLTDAARLLGMSRSRASNLWRLRHASNELAQANRDGVLSQSHLEELIKLERVIPHVDTRGMGDNRFSHATADEFSPYAQWIAPPEVAREAFLTGRFGRSEIREYIARLEERAGRPLIAEHNSTAVPLSNEMLQADCRQCPAKLNNSCVNSPCYDAKARHIARAYAAAHKPDVPWSDNHEHFWRNSGSVLPAHLAENPNDDKIVLGFWTFDDTGGFHLSITGESNYLSPHARRNLVDRIVYGRSEPFSRDDVVAEHDAANATDHAPRPMLEPRDEEPTAEEVWCEMWDGWLEVERPGFTAALEDIARDIIRQIDPHPRSALKALRILTESAVTYKLRDFIFEKTNTWASRGTLAQKLEPLREILDPLDIAIEPSAEIRANDLVNAYADVFAGEYDYDPTAVPFCDHDEIMSQQNEIPFDTVRLLVGARQLVTEQWRSAREELAIA